jgi:CIC family chloride channel protein
MSTSPQQPPRPESLEALPTGEALPVSPSLVLIEDASTPAPVALVDAGVLRICGIAIILGLVSSLVAQFLLVLIDAVTNLAFFQRFSLEDVAAADNQMGLWVIIVPVIGGLIIGFMARYGSTAIRGHGIPEAMEQVLANKSRIPARVTWLKPLSAAISIGTGGPFGAEGPIIATGGALGSVLGQILPTSPAQRKTLLAAGAAAGMAATFGTPLAAVLLAIELLLFEFRPRSLIPVALASAASVSMRWLLVGSEPVFAGHFDAAEPLTLFIYVLLGALMGLFAAGVTHTVYCIEDAFEKLPIHWMWWPAIGAIAVGVVGYFSPRTLGVGDQNISDLINGRLALGTIVFVCGLKFVSWSISLGSGTSGGTLAPLLTIGGGAGGALGLLLDRFVPELGVEPGMAALVGMASMFAGATRAPLASAVFAFEITMQPLTLLPLLGGSMGAYLVSCMAMQNTLMTEKISRRGIRTPQEYVADILDLMVAGAVATRNVIALRAEDTLDHARAWLESGDEATRHQGYPVLDAKGVLVGVLTKRDLRESQASGDTRLADLVRLPVKYVYEDTTLRQVTDHMLNHNIGRMPVMSRDPKPRLVGFLTPSDVIAAQRLYLEESRTEPPTITFAKRRHSR